MNQFKYNVLSIVRAIPEGKVITYKQLASHAGSPKAYRAAGSILAANQDSTVPCHRVVRNDGSIGSYNGLRGENKEILLRDEGVVFVALRRAKIT